MMRGLGATLASTGREYWLLATNRALLLTVALLAAIIVAARLSFAGSPGDGGPVLRGVAAACICFGIPSIAAAVGSGLLRARISTQELAKAQSRIAWLSARTLGLGLWALSASLLLALISTAVIGERGSVREYSRPLPESVDGQYARQGGDSRWWLVTPESPQGSLDFNLPLPHAAEVGHSVLVDVHYIRGYAAVLAPDPNASDSETPRPPLVGSRLSSASEGGVEVVPTSQSHSAGRARFEFIADHEMLTSGLHMRLVRGDGELVPGVRLQDVRIAAAPTSPLAVLVLLALGATVSALLAGAVGVLFGALFSRPTALLAAMVALVAGWLAPEVSLGEKPLLVQAFESHAASQEIPEQRSFGRGKLRAPWFPQLALPEPRSRFEDGESLDLSEVLHPIRSSWWLAVALVAGGWILLRYRDFEEETLG